MIKKGKVFIISGPSGSGKTTLYKRLLADKSLKNHITKSISVTTRSKREGERHGRDYFFVSHKMFAYKRRAGHFLESMKVFDNYYGTPLKAVKDILKTGKNVLLCIDVKGAKVVARKIPKSITIFLQPPDMKELKKRLVARGSEDQETVKLRLSVAKDEMKEAGFYDYRVTNDRIDRAYRELAKIIKNEAKIDI